MGSKETVYKNPPNGEIHPAEYWVGLDPADVLHHLGTNQNGLSKKEATARAQLYGENVLPHVVGRKWYLEFLSNFIHFFALLLWAGAILAWFAGMPQLSWAIIAVIVINGLFSYWQEYQAEQAAEALRAMLPHQVTVRRSGKETLINASDVVPGDLLILTEGESIPSDARILKTEYLRLDVSSFTGESRPISCQAEKVSVTGDSVAVFHNVVYAGTSVASGRGEAVVFATGTHTRFGHIAELTQAQELGASPLENELRNVTKLVTALSVCLGLIFFAAAKMLGGLTLAESFLFGIGIIVANVPEGLLPTLTLSLAVGVRRMAKRNALMKKLSAVETLGATTVILTDKTGTLTENEMTVREIWVGGLSSHIKGAGYEPIGEIETQNSNKSKTNDPIKETLKIAALCCDAQIIPPRNGHGKWKALGDPTEAAILIAAAKAGLSESEIKKSPRLAELPFDSIRKRMTTIQSIEGQPTACVKGAMGEIISRCTKIQLQDKIVPLDEANLNLVITAHEALARKGLRVLAVAKRKVSAEWNKHNGWPADEIEHDLIFFGLLAMEDPPRTEVSDAVAACQGAGIRVVMVTGDDGLTAAAIGREIGLHKQSPCVITGAEIDKLNPLQLSALIENPDVLFARTSPEHKLRLVEVFQQRGEVVAVTGDGVNDAPALKKADIGIAMGATGTDVAREAADMVLTDDNFANIAAAIKEGRAVFDNVRKFATYVFASNVPEMIPFIAFVLFRIPLPLTVMQILAVDVGTDLLPALSLGMERPEPDVMSRPPRLRSERLLNLPTLLRSYLWLGLLEAAFSMCAYFYVQWQAGDYLASSGTVYLTATTMCFAGIVASQVGNVFVCRSTNQTTRQLGFFSNRMIFYGIAFEIALMLLLIYLPPLQNAFGLAALGLNHWLLLLIFPILLFIIEESRKFLSRYYGTPLAFNKKV